MGSGLALLARGLAFDFRLVRVGADLIGLPSDEPGRVSAAVPLRMAFSRWKLSAVGVWNRRTTVNSMAVFSYVLRTCFVSVSWEGATPGRDAPLTSARPASKNADPGRG